MYEISTFLSFPSKDEMMIPHTLYLRALEDAVDVYCDNHNLNREVIAKKTQLMNGFFSNK